MNVCGRKHEQVRSWFNDYTKPRIIGLYPAPNKYVAHKVFIQVYTPNVVRYNVYCCAYGIACWVTVKVLEPVNDTNRST